LRESSAKPASPPTARKVAGEERQVERVQLGEVRRLGEDALGEGEGEDEDAHRGVEDRLDEGRRSDRGIARVGDRALGQEHADHVAAARRDDVVEAVGGDVGRPDALEREALGRVGGAQDVKRGPRAERQVDRERDQRDEQRAEVDVGQAREEIADSVEEGRDVAAERGEGHAP
jgi:hypothetical protein